MKRAIAILISFALCAIAHAGWTCSTFGLPTDWQVEHSDGVIVGKAIAVHDVVTNVPPGHRGWPKFTVEVLETVCGSNLTDRVKVRMNYTSMQVGDTAVIFMYNNPTDPYWGWTSTDVINSENAKVFRGQTFLPDQFPKSEKHWQGRPVSEFKRHVATRWKAIRIPQGERPYLEISGYMKDGKRVYPWPPQQPPERDK